VQVLQRAWWVNNVYTRPVYPGSYAGRVPGTISLDAIHWNHERSADILVSAAWNDDVNQYGYAGANTRYGTAGHGQDSPWHIQIRLVAAGPDIKPGVRSMVPTGNVDIAPTVLSLQGLTAPEAMQGRVMRELLRNGPDPKEVLVQEHVYRSAVTFQDGLRYEAGIEVLRVGTTPYLRKGLARRSMKAPSQD
jgi:arylsulfatase A-like enzyme